MNKAGLALCFAIVIISVLRSESSPVARTDDQKCKDLCNLCSCVGFYCGDECICECNNKDDENVNCVEAMQKKCEKLDVPYEVLIQGPAGSRFVRSLLTEDSIALKATNPKKRSSVSIFKPDENQEATLEVSAQTDAAEDDPKVVDEVKPEEEVKTDDAKPRADESQDAEETKAEEKAKREVDNKGNEKSSDSEQTKDEAAEQSKTNESSDKPKESTEEPKDEVPTETDKPTEAASDAKKDDAEKKLKKRDAETSEIQATLDEASSQNGPGDVSNSDSNTDADPTTEPTVGLALPFIPPALGLKLLPLQLGALNLDALKTNLKLTNGVLIDAKLAPLKARIAALKAETRAKLALLPILKPIL